MTFWLLAAPQSADAIRREKHITMPSLNIADFTKAHSMQTVKKILKDNDAELPPESVAWQAELIWRFIHRIDIEDILCFAHVENKKLLAVSFAKITGHTECIAGEQGGFVHRIAIEWFEQSGSITMLRSYIYELTHADIWPTEVMQQKLKLALRNQLPLPGNKFVRWKWLIILLICIKLFVLFVHLGRRF